MTKEIRNMRQTLIDMAKKEAIRLWRLARRCKKRGISEETVREIHEEACYLDTNVTAYPERILTWDAKYKFKYAFRY